MIYTITFNPSLDYVLRLDELSIGKNNKSKNEKLYLGGYGINVSRILNILGMKSILLGFTGGFIGDEIKSKLLDIGLENKFINLKDDNTRINIKIQGDLETNIDALGPNINDYSIALLLKQIDDLNSKDIVILSKDDSDKISLDIFTLICKKLYDHNISFLVDTNIDYLLNILKYNPFLVKITKKDLEKFINKEINTLDEFRYGINKLQELGALNVLVLVDEENIILVDHNSMEYYLKYPIINKVNLKGVDESVIAGFIYGFLLNKNYNEALNYAVACGLATSTCDDLASYEAIEIMLEKIKNK